MQQKLPLLRKEVVICPRRKEPVELVLAKGKKHLSKAEIEERKATEVKVDLVDINRISVLFLSTEQIKIKKVERHFQASWPSLEALDSRTPHQR